MTPARAEPSPPVPPQGSPPPRSPAQDPQHSAGRLRRERINRILTGMGNIRKWEPIDGAVTYRSSANPPTATPPPPTILDQLKSAKQVTPPANKAHQLAQRIADAFATSDTAPPDAPREAALTQQTSLGTTVATNTVANISEEQTTERDQTITCPILPMEDS